MQALIEGQVGYVRPLTEEEYKEKAQDVEEYYSDPFVQQNINDLAMKNILFDMNQPESYEKLQEQKDLTTKEEQRCLVQ